MTETPNPPTLRIAVLVGNPQPSSRTTLVAEEVAAQIADRARAEIAPTVELAAYSDRVFMHPEPELDALSEEIATSEVLVVASPTYKAAYTGLLKAFLDRYDAGALDEVVAIPILTIGSPAHALAVEHTLRPVLVELGAVVPTRGIAFPASQVDARAEVIGSWLETQWPRLRRALQP